MITIDLPPLRERREDILPLAQYFTNKFNRDNQRTISEDIKPEVLAALASLAPVESQAADFAPNVAGIVNQAVEKAQVPEPVATASSKFGPRWKHGQC